MAQDKETDEIQSKNDTSVEKENALTDWDNEPTVADLKLDLSATNVLDQKYRAFPNMPVIGRRTVLKLTFDY